MKITKYKKLKQNLYEVEIDNIKTKLYDDIIIKYGLLLQKEITKEEFNKITKENDKLASYYKALNYINIKLRSEKEIYNYLKRLNFDENDINESIAKLKSEGYINTSLYLKSYINDQIKLSYHGPYFIKRNLTNLGFNESDIDIMLEEIDENVWQEKLNKIIEKRKRLNKNVIDAKFINKTYMYLFNLGYSKEMISLYLNK